MCIPLLCLGCSSVADKAEPAAKDGRLEATREDSAGSNIRRGPVLCTEQRDKDRQSDLVRGHRRRSDKSELQGF